MLKYFVWLIGLINIWLYVFFCKLFWYLIILLISLFNEIEMLVLIMFEYLKIEFNNLIVWRGSFEYILKIFDVIFKVVFVILRL